MTGNPGKPPGCAMVRCDTCWAAAGHRQTHRPASARITTRFFMDDNFKLIKN
jgi:hypothetical protein